MLELDRFKQELNPRSMHVIRGSLSAPAASVGPEVRIDEGIIPVVEHGALLSFGKMLFVGNVHIERDAFVRRETTIFGSPGSPSILERYAGVMDYCDIVNSSFGPWAGTAHRGISHNADWGEGSFANIQVTLKGAQGKRVTVAPGAYLGPGVTIPAGANVKDNIYYAGDPIMALPNTRLDTDILEPVQGSRFRAGARVVTDGDDSFIRPITFSAEQLAQGLSRRQILEIFRLERPDLPSFGNLDITELGRNGVDRWLQDHGKKVNDHRPTLGNWLHLYPLVQYIKQITYVNEDARTYGAIAWHSAAMQSEVLHLARAQHIIETATLHRPQDLDYLVRSKLYLLGAYQPADEREQYGLNQAHIRAADIITRTREELRAIAQGDRGQTIEVPRQGNIDDVLIGFQRPSDPIVIPITKSASEIYINLNGALENARKLSAHTVPESSTVQATKQPSSSLPEWISSVNPNRVDITTIGPRINRYHGHVPVIDDTAVLVGTVDVGGAVEVGPGVVLKDGSHRSEQSRAPVFYGGAVYIDGNTIAHTATKEQFPVFVTGSPETPVVIENAQVHGAAIFGPSYIAPGAVIGDESKQRGVTAANTLNPGQKLLKTDDALGYTVGNFNVDPFAKESDGTLKYPKAYKRFEDWWKESPFRNIEISPAGVDSKAVTTGIVEIFEEKKRTALAEVDARVQEHGEIYRASPRLQAGLLNLQNAVQILESQGQSERVQQLRTYAEGIEYLLGMRQTVSADAIRQLQQKDSNLTAATTALSVIAQAGRNVSVPYWGVGLSALAPSYNDVLARVRAGIRRVSDVDNANFHLANEEILQPKRDNVMIPEGVIAAKFHPTLEFYPAQINLIARELARIPDIIRRLEASVSTRPGTQNKPRGAARTMELV